MTSELFFIYDSHCVWSYAATSLVEQIHQQFPDMPVNFWHCAHYSGDGDSMVTSNQVTAVQETSSVKFGQRYLEQAKNAKDSTLMANLLSWANHQSTECALSLLLKAQQAHFIDGASLTDSAEVTKLLSQLKLSPPKKSLTVDKLTKSAEADIQDIIEMQELIGTEALPALLLAVNDNLILLNHNLYLATPKTIIDAINIELGK